jgi:hypothetical protein
VWSDLACYALGVGLGILIELAIRHLISDNHFSRSCCLRTARPSHLADPGGPVPGRVARTRGGAPAQSWARGQDPLHRRARRPGLPTVSWIRRNRRHAPWVCTGSPASLLGPSTI